MDGADARAAGGPEGPQVYAHESPSLVYALAWSLRPDRPFRLAVGSFVEDYQNRVEVVQLDEAGRALRADPAAAFAHPYPPTALAFSPDRSGAAPDLLASCGDHVRLWRLGPGGTTLEALLAAGPDRGAAAPLTAMDWCEADARRLVAASVDTTCTVWDVERGTVEARLIAHDREVYDVAWGGAGVFASASADGSVRVFDLRDRDHSTIVYEAPRGADGAPPPLLRLAWNRADVRYMAVAALDSPTVAVVDIRFPAAPAAELARHAGAVNALAWAPHSSAHLATGADDGQALIWDLAAAPGGGRPGGAAGVAEGLDPILAYSAGAEVNALAWSAAQPDWVAICMGTRLQVLRV